MLLSTVGPVAVEISGKLPSGQGCRSAPFQGTTLTPNFTLKPNHSPVIGRGWWLLLQAASFHPAAAACCTELSLVQKGLLKEEQQFGGWDLQINV